MKYTMLCLVLAASLLTVGCAEKNPKLNALTYDAVDRQITVDGSVEDWRGVQPALVQGDRQLWIGQGMTRENWRGNADLSYSWRAAWHGNKLYFVFIVSDNQLSEPKQSQAYLNDAVELFLDWNNLGGPRVALDKETNQEILRGYELQFLPAEPVRVYVDHAHKYATDKPQTALFQSLWNGEAAMQRIAGGYVLEIGLSMPGVALGQGKLIGVENGVCDDDGQGRKSYMSWTGTRAEFWKDMTGWGQIRLVGRD